MKFTGHERDLANTTSAADDLDYMHARFYNPLTGRFLSTDQSRKGWHLKRPQSWNLATYTENNPLKFVDPNGESITCPNDSGFSMFCPSESDSWWARAKRSFEQASMLPGPAPIMAVGGGGSSALGWLASKVAQLLGRSGGTLDDAARVAQLAERFAAIEGRASILQKVIRPDGGLNVSQTVARQLAGERSFISTQSILDTIGSGTRVADPQGVKGAFQYTANAVYKGTKGVLEVLVDEKSGTILHALFKRSPK